MKAVDTNVLARILIGDDGRQAAIAQEVLASGPVFIPLAVCLELSWLLRSRYGFDFRQIALALSGLQELPEVTIEAHGLVTWALGRARSTDDLADLLLIISARTCDAFVTFDAGIEKTAGSDAPIRIDTLR